jgi:hypothetical protein
MTYTCLYAQSWLPNNFLVILLSVAVISFVYLATRFVPGSTKAKLTGVIRMEITQVFISMMIILALLGTTSFLCGAVTSVTAAIAQPSPVTPTTTECTGPLIGTSVCMPFPALPEANIAVTAATQPGDPFAYALAYTGNYAFDIGPNLAVQLYSFSYSYAIVGVIWSQIGDVIGELWPSFIPKIYDEGPLSIGVSLPIGTTLDAPYSILSDLFLDILSPIVMLGVGIMLFQYIILVVSQAAAFALILPIALIMRSLSFSGPNLRTAANSILAIAIALYVVYPVMIVFNSYFLHWLFTPCAGSTVTTSCNPEASYLAVTYSHDNLNSLFSMTTACAGSPISIFGQPIPIICSPAAFFGTLIQAANGLTSLGGIVSGASGDELVQGVQYSVLAVSEFMFTTIFLFAVDITVTMGLAMGMARAFDSGVEGASSFWSAI